ncbi:MAG TPA: alpha-amylase family glycosyl hydrolase, partial [Pelomicrobium sp.]|nr:alpha-amylase family glycosyl hydrolase [Pelomicrobium sp.]
MTRGHAMPFGAELRPGGTARFRLWAPSARSVELVLVRDGAAETLPMQRLEDGWCERVAPAAAGARYRFRIDGELEVPDPASRCNPDDVHGASELVDPAGYDWADGDWRGRPWHDTVIYELHVGTFSPEGTFAGVERRLDYLRELGATAIELMPVADFPGRRNWGYDGVLPYAPDGAYGRPEDLKRLIDAAHSRNLMVFIDVVYNHFGPEGNYLHTYAKPFFTERHPTPWGAGINFDDARSRAVRDFFIHNALYWLEEYHADGLRLDAVHAIADDSAPDILEELAAAVRAGPGRDRHVHLVLENDKNQARYLGDHRY